MRPKTPKNDQKTDYYRIGYNDGYCRVEQSQESQGLTVTEEAQYLRGYRAGQQDAIKDGPDSDHAY